MRQEASIAETGRIYKGLMARLAALQDGVGPDPSAGASGIEADELAAAHRRRIVKAYFGCGLVTSLIVGCAALLPVLYSHPGSARHSILHAPKADAVAARSPAETLGPEVFELPIAIADRSEIPLALQVTGLEPAQSVRITLRNVPETAWLSRGQRQDEHTWILGQPDLDGLRLSLRQGTPETFDMTIEVAATGSAEPAARSIARVRLLGDIAQPTQPVPDKPSVSVVAEQRGLDAPFRTVTKAAPRPPEKSAHKPVAAATATLPATPKPPLPAAVETTTAAVLPLPTGPSHPITRPEGMSALGALTQEPTADDARQMWWKMPLPAWAPFAERN